MTLNKQNKDSKTDHPISQYTASPAELTKQSNLDMKKRVIMRSDYEKIKKQNDTRSREMYYKYEDMLYNLKTKQSREIDKIEDSTKLHEKKMNELCNVLTESERRLNRILYFLIRSKRVLDPGMFKKIRPTGYNSEKKYLEEIEQYTDNDCIDLRMYIAENSRPKNKYSIVIVGHSKLGGRTDDVLRYPRKWASAVHTPGTESIEFGDKVFYSIKKATEYHKKHGIKDVMGDFIRQYESVRAAYKHVCKTYSLDDFADALNQKFEKYWNDQGQYSQKETLKKMRMPDIPLSEMNSEQMARIRKAENTDFIDHLEEYMPR